ncbi:MAG TPA: hypothetical protein VKU94_00790 [Geobacterales bacterium]|nr:hypothetical protein [Geobacterales bacterium]
MVAQLNKSDIKSAAVAFGRLVGYSVYLSNPFRTTDMKNSTLAQSFEAMIVDSDINDISIYKNITVSDVPTALASIGIKAVNLASILNKTAISKEQRDENYTKFISIMLSYTASVIYALLTKAINQHSIDVSQRNLYYLIALTGVILVLVIFANRKRLKPIRR